MVIPAERRVKILPIIGGGLSPAPTLILACCAGSCVLQMAVLYFHCAGLGSGFCCLLVFFFLSLSLPEVGDHLSATRGTRIDVQHSLGIQFLLHFKLQGQLGRNQCQSCQEWKHETNSPHAGCSVKHRDKGRTGAEIIP